MVRSFPIYGDFADLHPTFRQTSLVYGASLVQYLNRAAGSKPNWVIRLFVNEDAERSWVPRSVNYHLLGSVDIEQVPISRPRLNAFVTKQRPVRPGASISAFDSLPGTACAVVRKRLGRELSSRYLLSCEHVLFNGFGLVKPGQPVVQPARSDGGVLMVGKTAGRGGLNPKLQNEVDAGLVKLSDKSKMVNIPAGEAMGFTRSSDVIHQNDRVSCFGRTSRRSNGKIISEFADIDMKLPWNGGAIMRFRNLICSDYSSAAGDSGAPVVNRDRNELIGMHIGSSGDYGYACRIKKVFDRLQIELAK